MTRFSEKPPKAYKAALPFKLLHEDAGAWNLAYLSWDWESGKFPDAHLSVNVWQMMMFVPLTGHIDLANENPEHLKVRGLVKGPAPQVVHRLINLPRLDKTPMFIAYGQAWLDTMKLRSHLYREPFDDALDAEPPSLSDALRVIAKLK
jgi:hypothetical protein